VELLCPIRSKGKLIGILAVGKKQSGSPYSDEEVDLLMTIANEAAVAIENARMLDSLKNEQLRVSQLLTQAVQTQEEERKRISADLHDSVAQWLAAASYRAQTVNALLSGNDSDEAQGELAAMESTIDKSLKELRRVVTGLRPPALDELGLSHALRQSLENLKTDGVDCRFSEVGTPVRLPSSMEIAVYRVVQETLTNVRKHADATKVNLRLQFKADELLVEIRDNGKGFDLSQTLDSAISVGHMGLLGMKQRVETLGGDIKIKTGEGAGTTMILRLPVQPQIEEG
jgi:two-component system sensor histidine kinase DegS